MSAPFLAPNLGKFLRSHSYPVVDWRRQLNNDYIDSDNEIDFNGNEHDGSRFGVFRF